MRKVLLATTALVGVAFAGAAYAEPSTPASPISLNVGGYTDFIAGVNHESNVASVLGYGPAAVKRDNHDFETEFKLSFDALGKAANGIEYGANVSLWNGPEVTNYDSRNGVSTPFAGGENQITLASAYVWLSGAFGKILFGDEHGASDLFVYAPTVGEGQIDGRYQDFVDPTLLARFQPSGIDNTEHSTKVTYYTPKVGNDMSKVQLGVSYIPNLYDYGQNVVKYDTTGVNANAESYSAYQDVVKVAGEYWGNFRPINVVVSGQAVSGEASHAPATGALLTGTAPAASALDDAGKVQDFLAWGGGTQVMFKGFTVGGSYMNLGGYDTVHGQNKAQEISTIGAKYEFDKVAVAANWLTGEGYDNMLVTGAPAATTTAAIRGANYISSFNAEGAGATYTWFPGLTSNVDAVLFQQDIKEQVGAPHDNNNGYVFLVSQKLTF